MQQAKPSPRRANFPDKKLGVSLSTTRAAAFGFSLIAGAVFGFGIWSTTVPIASGVAANGQVMVASKRKQIQHQTGGVIRALQVEDGALVKAGDTLLKLEDADATERFTRARDALYLTMASEARLRAEAAGQPSVSYSPELIEAAKANPSVRELVDGQSQIFNARSSELRGQLSILQEQNAQLKNELAGIAAERAATGTQLVMSRKELTTTDQLFAQGYTTRTKLYALQRDSAQLAGAAGRLEATAARTKNAIIENELKIVQTRNQLATSVQNDLRDAQSKIPSLREQFRAAKDALERMTIRAPVAGTVVASQISTVGSVVRPGDTIMEIVPQDDRLMVEVQIHTTDVDSVKVGLETEIKFTGLSQRKTLPVHGKVTYVSADALRDPRTNAPYFIAHVDVPRGQVRELGGVALSPGMPASVLIKTGERTAMAYLTQPLRESIERAWRE